jgi:hypothetical protein
MTMGWDPDPMNLASSRLDLGRRPLRPMDGTADAGPAASRRRVEREPASVNPV